MNTVIPILRIFDIEKTKEFYLQFLGFKIDWEYRHDDNSPVYMQVSLGNCIIHLSEHHGDCSPGGAIRIAVDNINDYHAQLITKNYKYARPGLEETPWNTKEVRVGDPFGNRLIFYTFINK